MHRLEHTTLGTPLRQRTIDGMHVSCTAYAPDSRLPLHEHGHAYLCLVAAGGYQQMTSGRVSECTRGALLVHPQGHRHANRFSPRGARCLNVHLSSADMDAAPGRLFETHRQLRPADVERLLTRIECELVATDTAAPLAMQAAAFELVVVACRSIEARKPPWLQRVTQRLHDDPARAPSLRELAELAGVHPAHLARGFRSAHDMSIGEYLRRLRIAAACGPLRESRQPIAQIAVSAGFTDQSHFARVFKRVVGETPRSFRQKLQIAS